MIPVEPRAIGGKFGADALILFCQREQFRAESIVDLRT